MFTLLVLDLSLLKLIYLASSHHCPCSVSLIETTRYERVICMTATTYWLVNPLIETYLKGPKLEHQQKKENCQVIAGALYAFSVGLNFTRLQSFISKLSYLILFDTLHWFILHYFLHVSHFPVAFSLASIAEDNPLAVLFMLANLLPVLLKLSCVLAMLDFVVAQNNPYVMKKKT